MSFCKRSGGTGLRLVTPIGAEGLTWNIAKAFARDVCRAMSAGTPERYLIAMAKKTGGGRFFLDYLRNDRMATATAPRRRASAGASDPLFEQGLVSSTPPRSGSSPSSSSLWRRSGARHRLGRALHRRFGLNVGLVGDLRFGARLGGLLGLVAAQAGAHAAIRSMTLVLRASRRLRRASFLGIVLTLFPQTGALRACNHRLRPWRTLKK